MDCKVIYANSSATSSTPFDIHILLSTISAKLADSGLPDGNVVSESIDIIMSPQHFKMFAGALKKQIEDFEKIYGVIEIDKIEEAQLIALENYKNSIGEKEKNAK